VLVDLQLVVSNLDVEKTIDDLKRTPLDGVCLVDFKKLPDAAVVERVKAGSALKVFVGAAVPIDKGHVLAFPPTQEFDLPAFLEQLAPESDVIVKAREAGCATVACHPYHKDSESAMGDRILQCHGVDAVITVTGTSPVSANDSALDVLDTLGVPGAAGTGAGTAPGKAATLFMTALESQADLVKELRAGECWAVALGADDRWSASGEGGRGDRREGRRGGFSGRGRGGDRGGNRHGRDRGRGRRR